MKAIITVGLQFGDCGKGATVDFLCRTTNPAWGRTPDIVVRYCGGSQCAHTVVRPDGIRHTFAQWGSGTFAGVPTYLGPEVIINPPAMINEAKHLKEVGISDPFSMLSIHPDCLVSTFWHQTMNQLKELAVRQYGSCGHGIGEARHYWLKYGEDAIRANDLRNQPVLRRKMELLRQRMLIEIDPLIASLSLADRQRAALLDFSTSEEVARLHGIGYTLKDCLEDPPFEASTIAIFEGAQGILLDEWHGYHPYTTWSTVTPYHAMEILNQNRYVETFVLGITRAFTCRHGTGPHPTSDSNLNLAMEDPNNPWNKWQGNFRMGYLDLPLLKYAAAVVRLYGNLDGIALNHLDLVNERTQMATGLKNKVSGEPFDPVPTRMPILEHEFRMPGRPHPLHGLPNVKPMYRTANAADILNAVSQIAPVVIEGRGETYEQRRGIVSI